MIASLLPVAMTTEGDAFELLPTSVATGTTAAATVCGEVAVAATVAADGNGAAVAPGDAIITPYEATTPAGGQLTMFAILGRVGGGTVMRCVVVETATPVAGAVAVMALPLASIVEIGPEDAVAGTTGALDASTVGGGRAYWWLWCRGWRVLADCAGCCCGCDDGVGNRWWVGGSDGGGCV